MEEKELRMLKIGLILDKSLGDKIERLVNNRSEEYLSSLVTCFLKDIVSDDPNLGDPTPFNSSVTHELSLAWLKHSEEYLLSYSDKLPFLFHKAIIDLKGDTK